MRAASAGGGSRGDDDAETERSELYNLSASWDEEPVEGVEEMLSGGVPYAPGHATTSSSSAFSAFAGTSTTMSDAIGGLQQIVDDLQTRLDEAIAMNDSGITFGSTDGTVCYYLPDGVEDTVANVKAYNSQSLGDGAKDAEALQQARGSRDGVSEDGRTVEQILDEMAKHQDVPAYGAAVVQAFGGVDGYLDNLLELQWKYNTIDRDGVLHVDHEGLDGAVNVLGRVLASATRSGMVPEGFASWSDAMYESVTVKGHRGRMLALNALLAADDAVYETATLVDLADRLEDLPFDGAAASSTPDSYRGWYDDDYGVLYDEGKALRDYSMDPLYGVTMAMGNNPQAAFRYLNPDGEMSRGQWVPGEQTEARWKLLTGREWDSEVGLDGFTAAMAGVSAMRGSGDDETAAAATWSVARSMEFAYDLPFENYTEAMKENLSVVLANTAEEGVDVANGGYPNGLGLYRDDDSKTDDDDRNLYTTLIYRLIDNENAAATISSAFANAAMAEYPTVTTREQLEAKYREVGTVCGYLNAISSERLTDLKKASTAERKAAEEAMGTMFTVMTTVVGAGVSGPGAKLAWDVGKTVAKPIMVDQLTPDDLPDVDVPDAGSPSSLESQAYAEAVNQGLITEPEAFNPEYLQDDSGQPHSWCTINPDGTATFNLDNPPTSEQDVHIHSWANDIGPEHDPEDVLGNADRGINTGVGKGQRLVQGSDGEGGKDGDITIKRD
ncbi:DUF6571 family protein [Actinomyces sp. MRS3W]|uniref:DUF6571 family protein n=1 Tax=Actinomyces sp. MRS3W TaxID=2800796 RepID=UPI0028FDB4BA|nr:DUF6571 family protein [Actinomyces sp. MRS3W]MDU0347861.1 DUF6571 family protein [Actinomyces sp. MRS3W]